MKHAVPGCKVLLIAKPAWSVAIVEETDIAARNLQQKKMRGDKKKPRTGLGPFQMRATMCEGKYVEEYERGGFASCLRAFYETAGAVKVFVFAFVFSLEHFSFSYIP
ncbi:MAG: hypothetical protein ABSE51_22785 [Terracidiphilus sp.]|jgi:hypothetical protein